MDAELEGKAGVGWQSLGSMTAWCSVCVHAKHSSEGMWAAREVKGVKQQVDTWQ